MATEPINVRQERIERLLEELRYEIERGMLNREIEEEMGYRFVVPLSKHFKNGVVMCEFRTKPMSGIPFMGELAPIQGLDNLLESSKKKRSKH